MSKFEGIPYVPEALGAYEDYIKTARRLRGLLSQVPEGGLSHPLFLPLVEGQLRWAEALAVPGLHLQEDHRWAVLGDDIQLCPQALVLVSSTFQPRPLR